MRFDAAILAFQESNNFGNGFSIGFRNSAVETPAGFPELLASAVDQAKQSHVAAPGDQIIVLAGYPFGTKGRTNGLVVEPVE